MQWDLGQDDYDRTVYRGPEHRRCNRSSAANHRDEVRRRTPPPRRIHRGATPDRRWPQRILAGATGITAGSWYASPTGRVGYELIGEETVDEVVVDGFQGISVLGLEVMTSIVQSKVRTLGNRKTNVRETIDADSRLDADDGPSPKYARGCRSQPEGKDDRARTRAQKRFRGNLLRAREAAVRLPRFSFLSGTCLFSGQRLRSSP